ncbi:hypothetical protein GW7_14035, partial [Heterocephalus glaber]
SCLSLPSVGIIGMPHHTWLHLYFLNLKIQYILRLRQKNCHKFKGQPGLHSEFEDSLNYTVRPCLKK